MRARLALGFLKLAHSKLAVISLLPHALRAPKLFFLGSYPSASPQDTHSPFLALVIARSRSKPLDRGAEDIRRVS